MQSYGQTLCRWLIIAVAVKLALESSVLLWLKARQLTPRKRAAMLLTGELRRAHVSRYLLAALGGLLLPLVLVSEKVASSGAEGLAPLSMGLMVLLITSLLLIGELIERYLFFATSVAPRMPGAVCT